jgi:hypothetical protein
MIKNMVFWFLLTLIKLVKVLMLTTVNNNLLCNVTPCSPVKNLISFWRNMILNGKFLLGKKVKHLKKVFEQNAVITG